MSDLSATEQQQQDTIKQVSEPASNEGKILEENTVREEALKQVAEEKKEEEVKLPKLSAAEFRVYNSMAEHMEYFVSNSLAHNHSLQIISEFS